MPDIYKKTSSTWKLLNPEWKYNYLNSEQRRDMVNELAPSLINLYDWYKDNIGEYAGLLQCDLWRVVCLYEYGGVYADLDSICLGSLDGMLDLYSDKELVISSNFTTKSASDLLEDAVLGIPYDFQVNSGAGFAAKKGSTLLRLMIDAMEKKIQFPLKDDNLWGIFNYICLNADIDKISFDFRWSHHASIFNHRYL